MHVTPSSLRRTTTRIGLVLTAAAVGVVAMPLAAQAHVEVQPEQVAGGDFAVVALRVPNESDTASTTRVRVILPQDRPLASVQTTAVPGWKVSTVHRTLATPLTVEGAKVASVISEVTWTATAGGVRPGQFKDFQLSLGHLPTAGRLVFTAVQTYSDGKRVLWNEVSQDGADEPEHPAPTLTLTAPDKGAGAEQASDRSATPDATITKSSAAPADSGSTQSVLALVLSGLALVLAAGAAALTWRRGRA